MVAPMIKVLAAAKMAMAIPTTQPIPPPTARDLSNFFSTIFRCVVHNYCRYKMLCCTILILRTLRMDSANMFLTPSVTLAGWCSLRHLSPSPLPPQQPLVHWTEKAGRGLLCRPANPGCKIENDIRNTAYLMAFTGFSCCIFFHCRSWADNQSVLNPK